MPVVFALCALVMVTVSCGGTTAMEYEKNPALGELLDEMLHAEEDVLGESSLDPETERMLRRIEGRRMRQRLDRLVDLGAVALHDDDTITLTRWQNAYRRST